MQAMERIRLSGDLAKAVQGVQQAANPIQKISTAKIVAELLKKLGASGVEPTASPLEIVEYTTKKGKILRGIVRSDLTYAEAKAIDEYTFKYQGGWFIREKHLDGAILPPVAAPSDPVEAAAKAAEVQAERDAKKLADRVGKLRDLAATAIEKADAVINQDRNTNTSRRAGMAANITQRAEKDRALAVTMGNIADAMESGELQHLKELSSKAQLESMQKVLLNAKYQTDKNLSYSEQQKIQGRAPDQRDIDNAVIPVIRMDANWSSLANELERKAPKGYKKFLDKYRYVDKSNMTIEQVDEVLAMMKANDVYAVDLAERIGHRKRIAALGISTNKELGDALSEFIQFRSGARKEDPIKKAERELIGQKVGIDFFPTPASLARRMVLLAGITEGERVLEPSAGNGNLADAAKEAGAQVDVIEISSSLQNILKLKGYNLVDTDFDGFNAEQPYDAVIMNPPFSNRQDADHIMRAYDLLKSGGRLVAIAGEGVFFGSDKKAESFRQWLDSKGAEVEQLDKNTFMDKNLLATTGAGARLIVIEK